MSLKIKQKGNGFEIRKTDNKPSNPQGWKKRYDITCPHCDGKFDTAPSLFHMMGAYELGDERCPNCKKDMEIHFNPKDNSMTTHKMHSLGDQNA